MTYDDMEKTEGEDVLLEYEDYEDVQQMYDDTAREGWQAMEELKACIAEVQAIYDPFNGSRYDTDGHE